MSDLSAKGTRLNRRGQETRQMVLDVALRVLARGGPEAVSASRVAREAGVTWGTVQHQFGDVDGLWAAVLTQVSERGGRLLPPPEEGASLGDRVDRIVSLVWQALDAPSMRAIHSLRLALPRDREALERDFPRTASALRDWDAGWERAVREAFTTGVTVDPDRLHRVRSMLPGAVRGIHGEQYLSTYADSDAARRGLAEAITAYLSSTRP